MKEELPPPQFTCVETEAQAHEEIGTGCPGDYVNSWDLSPGSVASELMCSIPQSAVSVLKVSTRGEDTLLLQDVLDLQR